VHNLRQELSRNWWAGVYGEVLEFASSTQASKYATIAARLQQPGPPLNLALEHIALPSHRSALSSLLCGDWFLAVHAQNYFARNLVPQIATQINRVLEAGGAANTICLACWHHRREAFLEDEFHVLCVCPEYAGARRDFLITGTTLNHHLDMMQILQCRNKVQAEHLATFLIRTRQTRVKVLTMQLPRRALWQSELLGGSEAEPAAGMAYFSLPRLSTDADAWLCQTAQKANGLRHGSCPLSTTSSKLLLQCLLTLTRFRD